MLGTSPLSPSLVAGVGLTRLQVAFIVPSIYLGGLFFSLPGGRLADRIGVRPSLLGGLALGAAGLAAASLSPGSSRSSFACSWPGRVGAWSIRRSARGSLQSFTAPVVAGALAFAGGVGAFGWVGMFFVMSAELGGSRRAGLLSGIAFASIVVGLLVGPAVFGLLLVRWDSYAGAWAVFAALSALVTIATLVVGPAIDRLRMRSGA